MDTIPRKSEAMAEVGISKRRDGEVTLPDIKYVNGMVHPTELMCPDKNMPLGSWIDLLVGVADWLVAGKRLDKTHCPVSVGRVKSVLNTRPVHRNGKQFRHRRKAGHFYLDADVGPAIAIRNAVELIKAANLEPSDFKAYFGDPSNPDPLPKTA